VLDVLGLRPNEAADLIGSGATRAARFAAACRAATRSRATVARRSVRPYRPPPSFRPPVAREAPESRMERLHAEAGAGV